MSLLVSPRHLLLMCLYQIRKAISRIYVLKVSILPRFRLDFGTVQTAWYFWTVQTVWYFKTVLTVWYFRTVQTVWYFRTVQTVWYFRTVQTVWYFRTVQTVWYFRTVQTVWYFRTVQTVWYFSTVQTVWLSSSYVPYVASFSGLSIFDCLFGILDCVYYGDFLQLQNGNISSIWLWFVFLTPDAGIVHCGIYPLGKR
jgi:hypothetical protein